jgi:hypothetical protein
VCCFVHCRFRPVRAAPEQMWSWRRQSRYKSTLHPPGASRNANTTPRVSASSGGVRRRPRPEVPVPRGLGARTAGPRSPAAGAVRAPLKWGPPPGREPPRATAHLAPRSSSPQAAQDFTARSVRLHRKGRTAPPCRVTTPGSATRSTARRSRVTRRWARAGPARSCRPYPSRVYSPMSPMSPMSGEAARRRGGARPTRSRGQGRRLPCLDRPCFLFAGDLTGLTKSRNSRATRRQARRPRASNTDAS